MIEVLHVHRLASDAPHPVGVGTPNEAGFKAVNDRFGHAAGDRLLQVVELRLQQCMRGHDTVARLGGDEFVLVLTQLHGESECKRILERVLRKVEEPVEVGPDQTGTVSASNGVAFCPKDSQDPDELMRLADAAMYAAKRAGKNAVRGV
ncbi:GGDEF domain-containing protein [Roseateles paludis]|jgi:diguanylate cyclase (GGDEF)-like protein|uniref:GGDEF domain-containing protein n=1 Tax=Roseateles paludis TaxID=3145238 RepID=A0ABV0FVU5_9BURK